MVEDRDAPWPSKSGDLVRRGAGYGWTIVVVYRTVLSSAIDTIVAEWLDRSGSMASPQTPPLGSTVIDQNIEPARRSPTGQPGRTLPFGPTAMTLPPADRDGAAMRRYNTFESLTCGIVRRWPQPASLGLQIPVHCRPRSTRYGQPTRSFPSGSRAITVVRCPAVLTMYVEPSGATIGGPGLSAPAPLHVLVETIG